MLEIQLIVCPVDFSEFSVRAYRHALSLAEHYHAKLVALHVVELWRYPSLSFAATVSAYNECCEAVHEQGEEHLREFVKRHTLGGIHPEMVMEQGMAADVILSFARTHKAAVIVMGTHGRRGYDRLVLGSVTERVIRNAPCPVLVVSKPPEESWAAGAEEGREHHLRRVLYCTDFSENSEPALTYAMSASAEYGAELTVMHVLEESPRAAKAEPAIAKATAELERLIPLERRKTLKTKFVVRSGKPYQQILQLVKEARIDMVVMGVRGRGALDLAVFGSTTYRVIQLGSCPVLAVHI